MNRREFIAGLTAALAITVYTWERKRYENETVHITGTLHLDGHEFRNCTMIFHDVGDKPLLYFSPDKESSVLTGCYLSTARA